MPLSTEPNTFGQARDILEEERQRQINLFKKKLERGRKKIIVKPLSYSKELKVFLKTMRQGYREYYHYMDNALSPIPRLDDPHFREWVRRSTAYREFRERMVAQGVKIPGKLGGKS